MKRLRNEIRCLAVLCQIAAMIFVWSGCTRTPDEGPVETAPVIAESGIASSYEDFGQLHNDGLDFLEANDASPLLDPQRSNALLRTFLAARGVDLPPAAVDFDAAAAFGEDYLSSDDPADSVVKLYDAGIITANQQPYLDSAIQAILELRSHSAPVVEIHKAIIEIESEVIADRQLNESESDLLLKSLSVMRYSAQHWYQKSLDEASIAGLSKACKECLRRYWWLFVIYDGLGALSGAVLGPWGSIGIAIFVSFWSTGIYCRQCY
jgi:hypothetical protein